MTSQKGPPSEALKQRCCRLLGKRLSSQSSCHLAQTRKDQVALWCPDTSQASAIKAVSEQVWGCGVLLFFSCPQMLCNLPPYFYPHNHLDGSCSCEKQLNPSLSRGMLAVYIDPKSCPVPGTRKSPCVLRRCCGFCSWAALIWCLA